MSNLVQRYDLGLQNQHYFEHLFHHCLNCHQDHFHNCLHCFQHIPCQMLLPRSCLQCSLLCLDPMIQYLPCLLLLPRNQTQIPLFPLARTELHPEDMETLLVSDSSWPLSARVSSNLLDAPMLHCGTFSCDHSCRP